ncbi:MAG: methyltransferase, partial [Gemmatimonadetes bacterium]|nr:methyltransferase [Gemmatimonadota bacterium]
RDHLGGALNNLRFSESIWESDFFASAGFYTNRLQFDAILRIMKQAGFEADAEVLQRWSELPTPLRSLAHPFRNLTPDELLVATFHATLRPI